MVDSVKVYNQIIKAARLPFDAAKVVVDESSRMVHRAIRIASLVAFWLPTNSFNNHFEQRLVDFSRSVVKLILSPLVCVGRILKLLYQFQNPDSRNVLIDNVCNLTVLAYYQTREVPIMWDRACIL